MAEVITSRRASEGGLQSGRHLFSTQEYEDCNGGGNGVPKSLVATHSIYSPTFCDHSALVRCMK